MKREGNILEHAYILRGFRHAVLTMGLLVLSFIPIDELLPAAESSRYSMPRKWDSDCRCWGIDTQSLRIDGKRLPHRYDAKRKKWIVDTRRLRTKEGKPIPHRWDGERKKWVIDISRIKTEDYYPGMEED